jgi:vacuolar-type H+-ATPase subunit C/Vma6
MTFKPKGTCATLKWMLTINLLTALHLRMPGERKLVSYQSGAPDFNSLFVGPGRLPFALLGRAANQDTVVAAVEVLSGTPYEPPLRSGLEAYTLSNRLSSFEKHLKRHRLDWLRGLIPRDPLGIGVLLGYLALKVNETSNIRWIAHAVNLGLKPDTILMELELIA